MPNYTYRCVKCHNEHPEFHGMNDAPRVKCRVCHGKTAKQFGAGASPIFRGAGFHCNDYPKPANKGEKVTIHDKKTGNTRRVK
jgi:putative FmdB family regulatory protein